MTRAPAPLGLADDLAGVEVVMLAGGGIETTSLIPHLLRLGCLVTPLHVRCGLRWESHEAAALSRFCDSLAAPGLRPLVEIDYPLRDLLASHWAINGDEVPAADAPPARLEIPLRNITLLTAAAMRFRDRAELTLVTGTTADNHFGDGSRAFFDQCESLLSMATGRRVRVLTPYIHLGKPEIIRQSDAAALAGSWSCVDPHQDLQCGNCIKCGRRQQAFRDAGMADPTRYASPPGAVDNRPS